MIAAALDRWRSRLPLGWLQLRHSPLRLAVAVAGVAFADVLIFMQLGFMGALLDSNVTAHRSWNADLVLVSPKADSLEYILSLPQRRLAQALAVQCVADVAPVYVDTVDWFAPFTGVRTSFLLLGVDPARPAFLDAQAAAQAAKLQRLGTVLFDRAANRDNTRVIAEVEAGRSVRGEVDGHAVRVEGLVKLGATFAADGFLLASAQTFFLLRPQRSPTSVSLALVRLRAGEDPQAVKRRLTQALPAQDVRVLTLPEFIDMEQAYQSEETPIGFVFLFGSVMGFVIGLVIVYQVLYADVNEHIAEYATLKAMGYRDRYFAGVVFEEALILTCLGFAPGVLAAFGLYALTAQATALPMNLPAARLAIVFACTLAMCALAGLIALRRLAAADPADIF
jgi:putative ABC transport system permease protein